MSAAASAETLTGERDEVWRLVRALTPSRRRLVRSPRGWAVLGPASSRPLLEVEARDGDRLLALGWATPAEAGAGYCLDDAMRGAGRLEVERSPGASVFLAIGRPRARKAGPGFAGLAHLAEQGGGPLSLRQAGTGLRLIADAERAGAEPSLTMNWSATPSTLRRRDGARGATWLAAEARRVLYRLEQAVGEPAFRLAWAACVDGLTLSALEQRFSLARRGAGAVLADALERLAEAYDGLGR